MLVVADGRVLHGEAERLVVEYGGKRGGVGDDVTRFPDGYFGDFAFTRGIARLVKGMRTCGCGGWECNVKLAC